MVKFTPLFVMMAAMSVSAIASSSGVDSEELATREFEDSVYARGFEYESEIQARGFDDAEDSLLAREVVEADEGLVAREDGEEQVFARSIDQEEEHLFQRALEQSEEELSTRSFQEEEQSSSLEARGWRKGRKGRKNRKNRLHRVTVIFDEGLRKGNDEILIRIKPTQQRKKSGKKIGKKVKKIGQKAKKAGKKVEKAGKKLGMKVVNAGKADASKISDIIQSRLKDAENAKKTVEQKAKALAGSAAPKQPSTPPSMMAPQMIEF